MKTIYLDNAATTKISQSVLDEMLPFLKERYGNPGSMHHMGLEARNVVKKARKQVAALLGAKEHEIIFTGSGTESDNLAIFGYCRKNKDKGRHIITTKIEHHAVLDPFEKLKDEGFDVEILDVDIDGILNPERLRKAIRKDTLFVSVIYANNEIGTVQDIVELATICKENDIVFHTDACQAVNYLETDINKLGVGMMTINGSKIHGPKGIGALYIRTGIEIEPIIFGGGQEMGLRSGTENVANIVGFTKALEDVIRDREKESARLTQLRDRIIDRLLRIPETRLNGHPVKRLANNVNISFLNIEGESLILLLNEDGICVSTGSACTSSSLEPSHVIVALGLPHELGHSSIRISMGTETTEEDIEYILKRLPLHVEKLRAMSPLRRTISEVMGEKDGRR